MQYRQGGQAVDTQHIFQICKSAISTPSVLGAKQLKYVVKNSNICAQNTKDLESILKGQL